MKGSLLIAWVLILVQATTNGQSTAPAPGNWPAYGRDGGGGRFSPLNQLTTGNVNKLQVAWTFQTGELQHYEGTGTIHKAAFEATPVVIDGTMYLSTPSNRVFALDAATGKQKWLYDPAINLKNDFSEVTSRGVSAWPAGNTAVKRIFLATIDGRLIALDAKTGEPIPGFGEKGIVDFTKGLGGPISSTSPPAIINNLVIVGTSMGDNQRFDFPRGTVRAYDAITGELKWDWDPIPQDSTDKAWNTWNGPKAHKTGAANAWAPLTVDPQRDLVFVPGSSPSPDYYGGERLGQNLYGNSIVALRASTGKMVWFYQVVHHDLWDYDIAAQPVLMDVKKEGKTIPAVAVGTKMGLIFILHRETGKPLFPIEERAMPASEIPGETASATQPIPVLPKPLGIQSITPAMAWGPTEKDSIESAQRIAKYINKGMFTPPSFQGTIVTPGNVGGINWSGMSYDPQNHLLITNINILPAIIRMIPREQIGEFEKGGDELVRSETGRQIGTPYIMKRDYLFAIANNSISHVQIQPPWGTLLAIDVNTGEKKWEVPLGYQMDPAKYPDAPKWGSLSFGGSMVTAGNLIFVAGTRDYHLRAFDTRTGKELWKDLLPAGGHATPSTYSVNGKQFVVIAAGGHGKFATKMGDYVVAYSLP